MRRIHSGSRPGSRSEPESASTMEPRQGCEVPPEKAASELGQLSRRYGAKNIYISCDVLSPKYAVKLAEALIEKGVKLVPTS